MCVVPGAVESFLPPIRGEVREASTGARLIESCNTEHSSRSLDPIGDTRPRKNPNRRTEQACCCLEPCRSPAELAHTQIMWEDMNRISIGFRTYRGIDDFAEREAASFPVIHNSHLLAKHLKEPYRGIISPARSTDIPRGVDG